MEKSQRIMLMALPVVFVFFIIRFPMGLMLYWTTTNLWTVGQGLVTRRLMPKAQPAPKRTSRTPPKADDDAGNGAKPGPSAAKPGPQQQRVRRRKKKGPRSRR
jgi:YidC/Oxa1 family membrane protein insertase